MTVWKWLEENGAHHDVVSWAKPYEADWERAWTECPRGDWLLGLAARSGVETAIVVEAACECARFALDYGPEEETAAHEAIALAERWARGEAVSDDTRRSVLEATEAEVDAAPDPAVAAVATAALAALRATETPEDAPLAVTSTVQAALLDAGECAMMSAMGYAQSTCADKVRRRIPYAVFARSRGA